MEVVLDSFQKNLAPFGGSVQLQRRNRKTGETYRADSPEEIERANHQLRVSELAKKLKSLTRDEKLEWSLKRKREGNLFFRSRKYEAAIQCYLDAIVGLDYGDSSQDLIDSRMRKEIQLPILTNLSVCYLQLEQPHKVVRLCTEALELDKENTTAELRRAKAYLHLGQYALAKKDLVHVRQNSREGSKEYNESIRMLWEVKAGMEKQSERVGKVKEKMKGLWGDHKVNAVPRGIDEVDKLYKEKLGSEIGSTCIMDRNIEPSAGLDDEVESDDDEEEERQSALQAIRNVVVNLVDCMLGRRVPVKEFKFE